MLGSRNQRPADELFDLRRQIRTLEAEVDELRSHLQQHPDDLEGDEYQASIGSYQRRYIGLAGLEREIGNATLQRSDRCGALARTTRTRRSIAPTPTLERVQVSMLPCRNGEPYPIDQLKRIDRW